MLPAARVVSNTQKFDHGPKTMFHDELHCVVLTVLNSFLKQFRCLLSTPVCYQSIRGYLNAINSRFTYLLTYLLT